MMPPGRLALVVAAYSIAFAASAVAAPAPHPRSVGVGRPIDWTVGKGDDPAFYRVGTVTLRVKAQNVSTSGRFVFARPRVTVQMPGYAPVEMEGSDSTPAASYNRITVGRWGAEHYYVLLQSYSGSAYCCVKMQVAFPEGRRLRVTQLGQWETDFLDDLPKDIDKDGRLDFVFNDRAFYYRFASFADSYAPPQVINIVNGKPADVSAYPAFRPLFQRAMQQQRRACLGQESRYKTRPRNGACAAYVASAARVGQTGTAWQEMLRAYDRRSLGFPYELRRFLIQRGYFKR